METSDLVERLRGQQEGDQERRSRLMEGRSPMPGLDLPD